jgi:hypothetical protein
VATTKMPQSATTPKHGVLSKPGITPEGFEYIIEYEYVYDDDDLSIKDPFNIAA